MFKPNKAYYILKTFNMSYICFNCVMANPIDFMYKFHYLQCYEGKIRHISVCINTEKAPKCVRVNFLEWTALRNRAFRYRCRKERPGAQAVLQVHGALNQVHVLLLLRVPEGIQEYIFSAFHPLHASEEGGWAL